MEFQLYKQTAGRQELALRTEVQMLKAQLTAQPSPNQGMGTVGTPAFKRLRHFMGFTPQRNQTQQEIPEEGPSETPQPDQTKQNPEEGPGETPQLDQTKQKNLEGLSRILRVRVKLPNWTRPSRKILRRVPLETPQPDQTEQGPTETLQPDQTEQENPEEGPTETLQPDQTELENPEEGPTETGGPDRQENLRRFKKTSEWKRPAVPASTAATNCLPSLTHYPYLSSYLVPPGTFFTLLVPRGLLLAEHPGADTRPDRIKDCPI
ncbi:uncharacterized protein AKAME5_000719200 [Lates japonicus]|uniref:Uncharacterized protein n=1 Tax=Lates japonicus TaxID=270547 RepID=A0AAD3MHE6_LATJO|nr:uncharacterized protein AKAME5_000719200 [Lates japonicus]